MAFYQCVFSLVPRGTYLQRHMFEAELEGDFTDSLSTPEEEQETRFGAPGETLDLDGDESVESVGSGEEEEFVSSATSAVMPIVNQA